MAIVEGRIELAGAGPAASGWLVVPEGEAPAPAVIVCMEIFGVNAWLRGVCGRLAGEGFLVLAPDLFHRSAPGIELGYTDQDVARGRAEKERLRRDSLVADLAAARDALMAHPRARKDGRTGILGFCMGGHVAFAGATDLGLAAAVCFYGSGIATHGFAPGVRSIDRSPSLRGRVLCLYGGRDPLIPPEEVDVVRYALRAAPRMGGGGPHEVVVYPEAGHGFFCEARGSYDASAANDAWARTVRWLSAGLLGS